MIGSASSVDVSTKENLLKLEQIGRDLLKKHVSRVNLETGLFEEVKGEITNEEALTRFAKLLSEERRLRFGEMLDN